VEKRTIAPNNRRAESTEEGPTGRPAGRGEGAGAGRGGEGAAVPPTNRVAVSNGALTHSYRRILALRSRSITSRPPYPGTPGLPVYLAFPHPPPRDKSGP
jgi:hypothetical protein